MTEPARPPRATTSAPARASWRAVAVPTEHGGWGLTLEPVVLGLLVAWSLPGLALGAAALVAFVARTPLKVVLVDRYRHRRLERTRLAARIAAIELVVLAGLIAAVALTAPGTTWVPLVVAAPAIAVELWFDMRSRSRRLIPELCGAIGIASVAAAIALAGGENAAVAAGLWCVLAARSVASIPFVRHQIERAHARAGSPVASDAAQVAAIALAAAGVAAGWVPWAGLGAVGVLAAVQLVGVRRPLRPIKVIGVQQMLLGLLVVGMTAAGVRLG